MDKLLHCLISLHLVIAVYTSTFKGVPFFNPKGWWIDIPSGLNWHPTWRCQPCVLSCLIYPNRCLNSWDFFSESSPPNIQEPHFFSGETLDLGSLKNLPKTKDLMISICGIWGVSWSRGMNWFEKMNWNQLRKLYPGKSLWIPKKSIHKKNHFIWGIIVAETLLLKMNWFEEVTTGIIKWNLLWGDQTMQIYGSFQEFSLNRALFGLVM